MTTTQPALIAPTGMPALLVTHSTELAATMQGLTEPGQLLLVITPDQLPDAPWRRSPLILIDADAAPETVDLVGASLDTRKPVLLSAHPDTTPALWRAAVALRTEHVACLPDATEWVRDRLRLASRDNTLVITVFDVCGDPHGTALAAALTTASCAAGRDTLMAATSRHHSAAPALLDTLPALRPAAGHGELLLLTRDPDAPQVSAEEIHGVLAHALRGDTVIFDATPLDTEAARAATALADLTLLVIGPHATQRDALGCTADTIAQLAPHAHRLGLALAEQRPCHTPATTLAENLTAAAAHSGWTTPMPIHTWHTDPTPEPDPISAAPLLDLARSLLRAQLTPPRTIS